MAHALLGAAGAAAFGAGSGTWNYNRDNFMWDKTNKQNYLFQMQNMLVSQYSLYREDIRDLFDLTNNKMASYLVASPLVIGFIVTVFWNFDRTGDNADWGEKSPGYHQLEALFTIQLMTSFAFLFTCIWFAMSTVIISQSYMTKILVQTVRIPIPSEAEIINAVPGAAEYEMAINDAFRIPYSNLIQKAGSLASWKRRREEAPERAPAPDGHADECDAKRERVDELPHIKLYQSLKHNWVPYDFYCQVCMTIGISTLLQGLGYYVLYYQGGSRILSSSESLISDATTHGSHHPFGAFAFVFLSNLSWWIIFGSLDLAWFQFLLLSSFLLLPSAIVVLLFFTRLKMSFFAYAVMLLCNASWVCMLCYLTLATDDKNVSSSCWTVARYIQIFGDEGKSPGKDKKKGGRNVAQIDSETSSDDEFSNHLVISGADVDETWIDKLAAYGGQRMESVKSYEAQFQNSKGTNQLLARRQFKGLSVLTLVMWVVLIPYILADEYDNMPHAWLDRLR